MQIESFNNEKGKRYFLYGDGYFTSTCSITARGVLTAISQQVTSCRGRNINECARNCFDSYFRNTIFKRN